MRHGEVEDQVTAPNGARGFERGFWLGRLSTASGWEKLSRGQFFEGRVLGATCERAYADATTRQVPTGGALGSYGCMQVVR